ncbi:MAG: hypothetical protein O8C64_02930 [Candidatus Methanoperedens sp.]|nr:hypothetical protein [Candidatus Methanoperedens sp.]
MNSASEAAQSAMIAIEKMIEQGKIDEHPAYEDYLSALSYEQNINDLKKLLDNLVKRI